jgi:hypothetical protein
LAGEFGAVLVQAIRVGLVQGSSFRPETPMIRQGDPALSRQYTRAS